jgi:HD-GYP domain-containing protein (c-di-GMP phosphodiesterase class II)
MTSDRPYRAGMPQAKAVSILRAGRGQQWDPTLVDAFLRALGEQEGLRIPA